jgi:hypothetical protein
MGTNIKEVGAPLQAPTKELQTRQHKFKEIKISCYNSWYSSKKDQFQPGCIPEPTDLYTQLIDIKRGKHKKIIEKLLSLPEEKQKKFKIQFLLSFTPSCVTKNWRKVENIEAHSGVLCVDIDGDSNEHITDWQEVKGEISFRWKNTVVAVLVSCRKNGLAVFFKIDPSLHKETLFFISYNLKKYFNLNVDTACHDVTRLRFVSHDPEAYINFDFDNIETVIPTEQYQQERKKLVQNTQKPRSLKVTGSDSIECFTNAVAHAEYQFRIDTGMDFEFIPGNRHRFIIVVAGYCNARGMSKEFCIEQTRKMFSDYDYDVTRPINNVYEIYKNQHGTIQINENLIDVLQIWLNDNYTLRRNIITRHIENQGIAMQQKELNSLYLEAKREFPKLTYDLFERIINSNFISSFNPLIDFIEQYKYRRPTGVIRALFDTVESDTGLNSSIIFPDYKFFFGQKWLVGVIASIYGEHTPLMFVLTGNEQGTGKTEWLRRLLPKELSKYYAESKLDAGKDDEILMTQKIIIMDDEMGGKSKKDEKRLKEILSKQTFSLREPYGRNNVDLQRLAVLCGTTNDSEILSDPTGNRRIIPVNVLSIDQKGYNQIDKIDVFIEAYHLYNSGFDWRLNSNDVKRLNINTSHFEQVSAERDLITEYFLPSDSKDGEHMTPTKIKSLLEFRSHQKVSMTRLGLELKKLGFEKRPKKINGITVRGYYVIDKVDERVFQ